MPAIQLVPLVFKNAGFLQDGTLYQGDYCTNGQWVRFYQGKPKKMGGQRAITRFDDTDDTRVPENCTCVTSIWIGDNIIYIGVNSNGIYSNSTRAEQPNIFTQAWVQQVDFTGQDPYQNLLWQAVTVITANVNEQGAPQGPAQTRVVLFGCDNLANINNTQVAFLYNVGFADDDIDTIIPFEVAPEGSEDLLIQAALNVNGGAVFVNNFLFVYGTRGTVIWSRRENPFVFVGGSSGRINISNDKVIFGAGVRGGNNPPTILFWTMNSVVRVSNQTNSAEIAAVPEFQVDIITKESSILSSRSVVEYDGIFFWLGIDRMFFYNGIVREIVNNTNFDWFFANLDVERRQLVFGIKNAEKGEIWWYFPVLGSGIKGCSAALIYNIRENIWYNTDIKRDCGFFDGNSGKMLTYGQNLAPIEGDLNSYIWIHEEGIRQVSDNANGGLGIGITSYYTTPIMSFTAFSPLGEGGGQNNDIWIDRIEPDFGLQPNARMNFTVNARDYADQASQVVFNNRILGGNGKVDIRCQGRNISFTFTTTEDFIHGYPLIGIKVGDGR